MVNQGYINAFTKAAQDGDIDHVSKCLSEHPEVLNLQASTVCYINTNKIPLFDYILLLRLS